MYTNIEEIVKKILIDSLNEFEIEQIDFEQNFIEQGVNSIAFIRVVIAIEKEFGFEFEDKDLNIENFQNLNKLVNYIADRLNLCQ